MAGIGLRWILMGVALLSCACSVMLLRYQRSTATNVLDVLSVGGGRTPPTTDSQKAHAHAENGNETLAVKALSVPRYPHQQRRSIVVSDPAHLRTVSPRAAAQSQFFTSAGGKRSSPISTHTSFDIHDADLPMFANPYVTKPPVRQGSAVAAPVRATEEPATRAPTAQQQQQQQQDELDEIHAAIRTFAWIPGGVRGPIISEVESVLDRFFETVAKSVTAADVCQHHLFGADVSAFHATLRAIVAGLTRLDHETPVGDDCRYQLTPFQRALCVVMALADDDDGGEFDNRTHLTSSRAYVQSNCRSLVPCADWARGRFSITLSDDLLTKAFDQVVKPSLLSPTASVDAEPGRSDVLRRFSRQLLHGEGNFEELKWLMRRSKAMDEDLRQRLRKRSLMLPLPKKAKHPSSPLVGPAPLRDAFQGVPIYVVDNTSCNNEVGIPPSGFVNPHAPLDEEEATTVDRGRDTAVGDAEGGGGVVHVHHHHSHRSQRDVLSPLSSLEFLAALRQLVGPPLEGDVLNVMVFNGDSVNREVFHRVIHHIRFGLDVTPEVRANNANHFPIFHVATHYDMVYAVYPTHDELLGFHSPLTDGKSTNTVEGYFLDLRLNVTKWAKSGGGDGDSSPVALFYMVFYWDPFTTMPRSCAFGTDVASFADTTTDETVPESTRRPSSEQGPLSHVGVHISALIQGTAFWERYQGEQLMSMMERLVVRPSPEQVSTFARGMRLYLLSAISEDLLAEARPYQSIPRNYHRFTPFHLGYEVPLDSPNYNLRKNIGYFKWLRQVALERQQLQRASVSSLRHQNGTHGASPEAVPSLPSAATHPRLFVRSVQILDKAKAQFMGEPLRDKIHFTCRSSFASGQPKYFEHAFEPRTLQDLLYPAEPAQDSDVYLCKKTKSVVDVVRQLVARFPQKSPARHDLWVTSRMEETRMPGALLAGNLIPSAILARSPVSGARHPPVEQRVGASGSNSTRTVLYVFPDGARRTCTDPGDLLLVQLLVQNSVLLDEMEGRLDASATTTKAS